MGCYLWGAVCPKIKTVVICANYIARNVILCTIISAHNVISRATVFAHIMCSDVHHVQQVCTYYAQMYLLHLNDTIQN